MAVAVQAGDVDAVERLWRDKWQALDERGRGAVSFAELPQLLDELGVALTPQELEDAAARIQKWQGSRLLLQGFLRWFLGDGGGDRLLGQQKGDKRKLRAAEAEVAKLRGELDALRKEQADRVVTEARRKGDEAALVARAEAAEKLVDECRAEHAGALAERDATLEAVRREGAAALAKAQTDGAAVDALRARLAAAQEEVEDARKEGAEALQKAEREAADALATNSTALDALRAELEAAKTQGDEALEAARREGAEALETAKSDAAAALEAARREASEAPTDDAALGALRAELDAAREAALDDLRADHEEALAAAREEAAEALAAEAAAREDDLRAATAREEELAAARQELAALQKASEGHAAALARARAEGQAELQAEAAAARDEAAAKAEEELAALRRERDEAKQALKLAKAEATRASRSASAARAAAARLREEAAAAKAPKAAPAPAAPVAKAAAPAPKPAPKPAPAAKPAPAPAAALDVAEAAAAPDAAAAPAFAAGARVEARFEGKDTWYAGTVARHAGGDRYDVAYDDGDRESNVAAALIRAYVEPAPAARGPPAALLDVAEAADGPDPAPAPLPAAAPEPAAVEAPAAAEAALLDHAEACDGPDRLFAVGDRVEARFEGKAKYYAGAVAAVTATGYDIAYDDGDRESNVAEDLIRRPLPATAAPEPAAAEAPAAEAALLDVVEMCEGPDAVEEPATVATPEPEPVAAPVEASVLDVVEACEGPDAAEPEPVTIATPEPEPEPVAVAVPEPARVEAALLDVVEPCEGPDAAEEPITVATPEPEPLAAAEPAAAVAAILDVAEPCDGPDRLFAVGDRVEARFQGKAKYYSGIVSAVTARGYDIAYDDGDHETGVAEELLRREFEEPSTLAGDVIEDEFDYDFEPLQEFGFSTRRLGPEAYVELAAGGAPKEEVVALLVRDGLYPTAEAAAAFLDAQDVYDTDEVLSGPLDQWGGDHVEACWPVVTTHTDVYVGTADKRHPGGIIKRDADPRNRGASARRVTIGGVATSSAGGATPLKIKTFEQHDPPSQIQQTAEEATSSTLYDAAAFATPAAPAARAWQPPGVAVPGVADDGDDIYDFEDDEEFAEDASPARPPAVQGARPDLDLDAMIADFEGAAATEESDDGEYSDSFEDD